jgi:ankyrin repeat protein
MATKLGDLEIVKLLISKGADVNVCAGLRPQTSLLHVAAEEGKIEIVKFLVSQGADINATNSAGETPLGALMRSSNAKRKMHPTGDSAGDSTAVIEYLASLEGSRIVEDVHAKDNLGVSPLHRAALAGDIESVKALVSQGANVNVKSSPLNNTMSASTPLDSAVWGGHLAVVQFLVSKGANINTKDHRGNTPLHSAVWRGGHIEIIKFLVSQGADINAKTNDGYTPLHLAKSIKDSPSTKALGYDLAPVIEYLSSVEGRQSMQGNLPMQGNLVHVEVVISSSGDTPLHKAAALGDIEFVKSLVSQGADVNAKSTTPNCTVHALTPIGYAVHTGHIEIVQFLVSKGANINIKDKHGTTLLHLAMMRGNLEMVKLLVSLGADSNVKRDGLTLLDFAQKISPQSKAMGYDLAPVIEYLSSLEGKQPSPPSRSPQRRR